MRLLKRILIAVAGGTVLLLGVIMIILPGPALLVIPAGLAILAVEFAWARVVLHKIRAYLPKKKGSKSDQETNGQSLSGEKNRIGEER